MSHSSKISFNLSPHYSCNEHFLIFYLPYLRFRFVQLWPFLLNQKVMPVKLNRSGLVWPNCSLLKGRVLKWPELNWMELTQQSYSYHLFNPCCNALLFKCFAGVDDQWLLWWSFPGTGWPSAHFQLLSDFPTMLSFAGTKGSIKVC